ncbi:oligoendopeptidase F [Spiroplasma endosymbiont of Amphibalanus improvisus]|uniref:oligoendopeptidase F n=1 Tax=Spiroplasma endosymbiont of Amphibalanus improvisus TaxID=3066327 RepID=UPI00313C7D75
MKRPEAAQEYKWDFTQLYTNDELWKKDLKKCVTKLNEIIILKGKLDNKNNFLNYIKLDEEVDKIITKMSQYIHYGDINQSDVKYKDLSGLFSNTLTDISSKLSFINPELKKIGEEKIIKWLTEEETLNRYINSYKKFFKNAKYFLEEEIEYVLSTVSRSRNTANELYDLLSYADKNPVFIEYKGEKKELTNSLYSEIMKETNPIEDQELRILAANKFTEHLKDKKHSLAKVYEAIIIKAVESIKIRGFKNTLFASLLGDEVSEDIYHSLIVYGKKYSSLFVDYNNLLKKHWNLDKFYSTDRGLTLAQSVVENYSVEDAKKIIKEALNILGDEYLKKLEIAWGKNKIDYFEDTNKRDGAYSSGGWIVEPIILMNWDNKIYSVNTLAHEVGHSVHTLFADEYQQYPLSNYPIILAEVASTLNEHLLFDYLYKKEIDINNKINLIQTRIEEIMGTFFRQIHFADFELQAHKLVEENNPLNAEILANLFKKISDDFGYTVFDNLDDKGNKYSWTRILHFFNSPYYVYKYATSIVASFKLYEDVKNGNVENVMKFLKSGGSKPPLDILKEIGIDYTKNDVYEPLINKIKSLMHELETLLKSKKEKK